MRVKGNVQPLSSCGAVRGLQWAQLIVYSLALCPALPLSAPGPSIFSESAFPGGAPGTLPKEALGKAVGAWGGCSTVHGPLEGGDSCRRHRAGWCWPRASTQAFVPCAHWQAGHPAWTCQHVCMYVCMGTRVCTRAWVHVHVCTCARMFTCVCAQVCMYMLVHMGACAHMCLCSCVHMCTWAHVCCTCLYTRCMCIRVRTCSRVYVCMHACMCLRRALLSIGLGCGDPSGACSVVPQCTGMRSEEEVGAFAS